MRKPTQVAEPEPAGDDFELLTDPQAARLANVGATRWNQMQREPGFPAAVWLGPRGKRHVRARLIAYLLSLARPAPPPIAPQAGHIEKTAERKPPTQRTDGVDRAAKARAAALAKRTARRAMPPAPQRRRPAATEPTT